MRSCILIIFLIFSKLARAQSELKFTATNFGNEVLAYRPFMRPGVTEQKFAYAQRILEGTRSATKNDPKRLNAADLWNITTAFVILKEPREHIKLAFTKATLADPATICEYISSIGSNGLDTLIPGQYRAFYLTCAGKIAPRPHADKQIDIGSISTDQKLTGILSAIRSDDQRYRRSNKVDWSRQHPLDLENQKRIDSLYQASRTYIGRKLAGKNHETVMWQVIQHSGLEMMERYLPVVWQAVKEGQLDEGPFSMLMDRIYSIKYGYQIFGSQAGVPLAKKEIRDKIAERYKLTE